MPPLERVQVASLLSRLREKPRIIALSGLRQAGKTTIVRQALARLREEDRIEVCRGLRSQLRSITTGSGRYVGSAPS